MRNAWIWIVLLAIIIVIALIWWQSTQTTEIPPGETPTVTTPGTATTTGTSTSTPSAPMTATVTYTATGFSPSPVTIKKGGTVTFVNGGTGEMWVASGPHPDHDTYDSTSRETHCAAEYTGIKPFDQCAVGSSYSFTFTKTGSWGYHNHKDEEDFGRVVVVE